MKNASRVKVQVSLNPKDFGSILDFDIVIDVDIKRETSTRTTIATNLCRKVTLLIQDTVICTASKNESFSREEKTIAKHR